MALRPIGARLLLGKEGNITRIYAHANERTYIHTCTHTNFRKSVFAFWMIYIASKHRRYMCDTMFLGRTLIHSTNGECFSEISSYSPTNFHKWCFGDFISNSLADIIIVVTENVQETAKETGLVDWLGLMDIYCIYWGKHWFVTPFTNVD